MAKRGATQAETKAKSLGSLRVNASRKTGGAIDAAGSSKRQLYADYGWPRNLRNYQILDMFRRSGLAEALVEQTLYTCWQETPIIRRGDEDELEPQEQLLNDHLEAINFWGVFRECHRRSMVTSYAGLVLRVADDQMDLSQPLLPTSGGIEALVEVIPVWADDLKINMRGVDPEDTENYGRPITYDIIHRDTEGRIITTQTIHRSRVIIVSKDGTLDCVSEIEKAWNSISDAEKVRGAGGEAAWKNSRAGIVMNLAADADLVAVGGVEEDEPSPVVSDPKDAAENLDTQIENFYSKSDNAILTQGMDTTVINSQTGDLTGINEIALQHACAAFKMPVTILRGIEVGEKTSTENAKQWARACESRREFSIRPIIRKFIQRMQETNLIDAASEFRIEWTPLTAATFEERKEKVKLMLQANQGAWNQGRRIAFTEAEVRSELGYDPLEDEQIEEAIDRMFPDGLDEFGADDPGALGERPGQGGQGDQT